MGIISRIAERVRAFLTDQGNSALKKCFYCRAKLLSGVPQTPVIPTEARILEFKSRRNPNTHWMPKLLLQSLLSFVVTSIFVLPSVAATSLVGATQGQFQVSESGAANYTIPISLPPGTAGMQPSLSLSYNSQGGNGLLGMGWSLGGLSGISRCPQTQAQDGVRGAVNFDANDRFCLDGQRLMVISGVYGAAGAEYRTERESYSRIISYGAAGNGPAYFKVWTKSGQVMEYGVTADSQIQAQGKTSVSVWALNKVQDTVGNYLTVTYLEDNANGQFYPTRIDYTGNASKGLVPFNSVQFLYEARPDVAPAHHAGSLMKTTVRMTKVQSYSATTLTREYRLTYNQSAATLQTRLATLTECAGDGICLTPTSMSWQTGISGFAFGATLPGTSTTTNSFIDPSYNDVVAGDFNGDGKTDFLHLHPNPDPQYSFVALSNGDGTFTFSRSLPGASAATNSYIDGVYNEILTGDFNGDGKTDFMHFHPGVDPQQSFVALSNGDGTFTFKRSLPGASTATNSYIDGSYNNIVMGDFNGDGKTDFMHLHPSPDPQHSFVALSNGDGTFTFKRSLPGASTATNSYIDGSYNNIVAGDFNGDGKTDFMHLHPSSDPQHSFVALSNGDGTFAFSRALPGASLATKSYIDGSYNSIVAGDFNGDGKTDLMHLHPNADPQYSFVALSKGDGTFIFSNTLPGSSAATNSYISPPFIDIVAGDFNGDGKTDFMHLHPNADPQYSFVALSNGDGTFIFSRSLPGNSVTTNSYVSPPFMDIVAGDFNGDGKTDFMHLHPNTDPQYSFVAVTKGPMDFLSTITTGLGSVTNITYKPLTDNSVYAKEPGSTYPTLDIQAPIYVVSSSSTSNGIGGSYSLNYKYSGMKASQDGRGMLGFRSMDTTDPQTGIVTHNEYRQDYPYTGLPSLSTKKINGTLLNQAQNTYTATPLGGTRYAVQLTQSVESSYELNGSLVTTVTTTNQYDTYGNPTQIVVGTGDGYSKTTTNTYTNDSTNWLLGRLTLASVTSTMPVTGSLTRTSSFAYNPTTGLLTQEVIEPNNVALRLQTDYTYDGYGNKLSVTVSGSGIITRTTSSIFDARGQFPTTTTNALNHSDTGTYDARFGKALTLTGPNALTTTWSYDGFGRKINETRADATQTNVAYNLCDASCPNFAKYYVSTTTLGSPISYAYFDMLNREIRVQTQGFDGRLITKDTYYDSFGRVDRVTKPYYSGDSPLYSYLAYDGLSRPIQETAPDTSIKQIAYNGLTTTVTNALSQRETKTKNTQGQLASVTDNLGNVISYQYDPFGNLTKTTDPKGNQTTLTYDARGRKIGMVDPDMGSWTYTYNVLGELIQQKDAKNQIVNMTYDKLGRMLSRSEPDLNSTWVYDTATKGVGKLKQVSSDNGFLRVYTYDTLGRVSSETSTIDTTYNVAKTYDAYGRVNVLTYPTGFAVKNVYNAYGYLTEVRNNATSALFWKGNSKDADGHVLNETLGNGLTTTRTYTNTTGRISNIAVGPNGNVQNQTVMFDALGNLIYRYDPAQAQSETFSYDGLNRLITTTKGAITSTVAYDSIGNITNKSDVGNYTYGTRPHAVTQVASSGGVPVPAVNVALQTNGAVASASSVYNNRYPVAAVNNGDRKGMNWGEGGGWHDVTASTYPDWVQIDFSGSKTINEIDVYSIQDNFAAPLEPTDSMTFAQYGLTALNVQYWDGSTWVTVPGGAISGNNKVKVKLSFANITTSKIRVQVNGSLASYSRIAEIEAWTPATSAGSTNNYNYTYDNNGNLTSGAGRTVTLTSYNLPSQITQGANSVNFIYDAGHTRIKQSSASGTTIYLNPRIDVGMHFEKEVKGGVTEYKHYIYGASGVVGVYTTSSAASPKTSYFHQDHLGSIVAVTNDSGSVIARYAFDPWGKRLVLAGSADATHHGFTGHEHLDEVGLVHMNGRVYDPVLGRFMSADPYIQAPDNLQSYNRYSYVWNNPLSATDPSGYFKFSKFGKSMVMAHIAPTPKNLFNAIHNQPGQKYIDGALLRYPLLASAANIALGAYFGPVGSAAFSAYMAGLQGGGNFEIGKAFTISLATSAAFYAVGTYLPGPVENFLGHAAVGCLSSAAGGGSCQAGAASAGLANALGGGLIVSAIAGGVGAELGGGKFANGAVMGAFGYLFNKCAHEGGCWGRALKNATGMTSDWIAGTGPDNRVFGGGSDAVNDMMNAPGVERARQFFYDKNINNIANGGSLEGVENYRASFGLRGLFSSGLSPTQQFVGSFRVDITPYTSQTGTYLHLTVTNNSSMQSFLAGIGPAYERSSLSYGGNMRQTYSWVEPMR